MPTRRDHDMLVDASRMYYIEGLDQGQVGRRMGVSRSSVSRMLATARELGIVQVRIAGDDHVARNRDLESALLRTFGLREVLVAETASSATALKSVAQLASHVFVRRAPGATRIGFSWGYTIRQLVEAIPQQALRPDAKIIPLVGGMPSFDTAASGNTIIQTLADKAGVGAERFDAPAIVESAATHHAMMRESSVRAALNRARSCDLAFIGIGSFGVHTSKRIVDEMKLSPEELADTLAAKPVGDVVGRFFDIDGVPLGPPTSERVIGIDIPTLAEIDVTIGMAAGKTKARGVVGALRAGILDVLVVDEGLAAAVLATLSNHPSTGQVAPG